MAEGVDFSRDGFPGAGLLRQTGKTFVGRYVVDDLSPGGRGITAQEYADYRANNVDVYVYWESTEGWMLDGFAAGQQAARNAESNLANAGMPATTPVYFACDFDATPEDQVAIDDCLRGAASVMGIERVGIYGGYWIVKRCYENKTASFFCQTSAWSGGNVHPNVHLYQYAYNAYFNGVNCDLVRSYQGNFGQATPPAAPAPTPPPAAPAPPPAQPEEHRTPFLPPWWAAQKKLVYPVNFYVGGGLWLAARGKSTVVRPTQPRLVASLNGRPYGPELQPGDVVMRERIITAADGKEWVVIRASGQNLEGARVLRADLEDAPEMPEKADAAS